MIRRLEDSKIGRLNLNNLMFLLRILESWNLGILNRKNERGQYAPLIALMLGTVILPVAGLIMDGAYLYMQKTQLQVMADNAAKSGVFELVKQVSTGACSAQLDCDTVDKKDCACYDAASCTAARVERNQKAKDAAKDYAVKNG